MDTLIQTAEASIVYGFHDGKENQELFRCPRELDNVDLRQYINENRSLVGFEDDRTEDLRNVEGKDLLGYFRFYFRGGWDVIWLGEGNEKPDKLDCAGADRIYEWLRKTFPNGCDWHMKDHFMTNHLIWGDDERYLIKPKMSEYYKVQVNTRYGNGDYPVRIYVYRDKATKGDR